mgnify:CR=1 FL=1
MYYLLIKDSFSQRIVEKILNKYDKEITTDLLDTIYKYFVILANHPTSSNFIKKIITNFRKDDDIKTRIVSIIKDNFNNLVQNQNGNIVFLTILNV